MNSTRRLLCALLLPAIVHSPVMAEKFPAYERIINSDLVFNKDWGVEVLLNDDELRALAHDTKDGVRVRFLDLEVIDFNPKAMTDEDEQSLFSVTWVKNEGDFKVDDWTYVTYNSEEGIHAHTAETYVDADGETLPARNYRILDIEFEIYKDKPVYQAIFVRNEGDEQFHWDWVPAMMSYVFDDAVEEASIQVTDTNQTVALGLVDIELFACRAPHTAKTILWQCGVLIENPGTMIKVFTPENFQQHVANGEQFIDVEEWREPGSFWALDDDRLIGICVAPEIAEGEGELHSVNQFGLDELGTASPPRRVVDFDPHPVGAFEPAEGEAAGSFARVLTIFDPGE